MENAGTVKDGCVVEDREGGSLREKGFFLVREGEESGEVAGWVCNLGKAFRQQSIFVL